MPAAAKKIENGPELLSISEIGRRLRLDRATVSSRLDDLGYEPHETSTAKLQLYEFDSEMEFAIKAAKDSLTASKIRLTRADYQMKELKLAQARGELVPMNEAIDMVREIVLKMYQEYTVAQPKKIAPKLAKAKNVTAVKKILKADTDRIMKNLRQNFEKFLD